MNRLQRLKKAFLNLTNQNSNDWSGEVPEPSYNAYISYKNYTLKIINHTSYRMYFIPIPKGATSVTINGDYIYLGTGCICCNKTTNVKDDLCGYEYIGNINNNVRTYKVYDEYKYFAFSCYKYKTILSTFEFSK